MRKNTRRLLQAKAVPAESVHKKTANNTEFIVGSPSEAPCQTFAFFISFD